MIKRLLKQTLPPLVAALVAAAGCGTAYAADTTTEQAIPAVSGVELPSLIPLGFNPANVFIARGAEQTNMAWQWARGVAAADYSACGLICYPIQRGFVFEVMANDARNWRHPFVKASLMPAANAQYIDAQGKNIRLQMKASANPALQQKGLNSLAEQCALDATLCQPGEVIVPKNSKTLDNPAVKESPVSEKSLRDASEAVAKAESMGGLVARGGLLGAAVGAGLQGAVEAWQLHNGDTTLPDSAKRVGREAVVGGVAGVAVTAVGVAGAAAALPGAAIIAGSLVVGAGVAWGAREVWDWGTHRGWMGAFGKA